MRVNKKLRKLIAVVKRRSSSISLEEEKALGAGLRWMLSCDIERTNGEQGGQVNIASHLECCHCLQHPIHSIYHMQPRVTFSKHESFESQNMTFLWFHLTRYTQGIHMYIPSRRYMHTHTCLHNPTILIQFLLNTEPEVKLCWRSGTKSHVEEK